MFVTKTIPKDTLVWEPTHTAEFRAATQFRRFWCLLSPSMACDVLLWAYTHPVQTNECSSALADSHTTPHTADSKQFRICVELDEAAMINHGEGAETNVQDREVEPQQQCSVESSDIARRQVQFACQGGAMYATRDIAVGEELRMDYDEFSHPSGWRSMGL